MPTLAVAWALTQPAVTCVLVGATRAEQLNATLGAVDVTLDEATRTELDALWYTLPRRPAKDEE